MKNKLKERLERLYLKFNDKRFIVNDPIEFPHRYKNEEDILLVGFISALYSYGKVNLFKNVLERIFNSLGSEPAYTIKNSTDRDIKKFSEGNYYRFYKSSDTQTLLRIVRNILHKNSLKELFERVFKNKDILSGLIELRRTFISIILDEGNKKLTDGIKFMFPDPISGNASKRLFMFLRWMVRKDIIDFGIIKVIKTSDLIIPLDTHIANIGRMLKMTSRKSNDLKCAIEITNFLKTFDSNDPVKYDFSLSHIGISAGCKHKYIKDICQNCILSEFCNNSAL